MTLSKLFSRPPAMPHCASWDARWLGGTTLVATAFFIWIALSLAPDAGLHTLDTQIAIATQSLRAPWLNDLMWTYTYLNSNLAINIYTALIAIYLVKHQIWRELALLIWIVPGGLVLNNFLKHVFARTRPPALDSLLSLSTYSFPSGHVTGATLFYGLLALCLSYHKVRTHSIYIFGFAFGLIAFTGLSRVYLGVHFFSDVMAGFCVGLAWLGISLLLARWLLRRRVTPSGLKSL